MRTNFKTSIKTSNILTPEVLLKTVQKKGYFPKYSHNIANDSVLKELYFLADKYRQTLSIIDKAKLIKHERYMLYEELEHPELTLARNYSEIQKMRFTKKGKRNIVDVLNLFNTNALRRIESLKKPFKSNASIDKFNTIERVSNKIKPTNKVNKSTLESLKVVSDWLKDSLTKDAKNDFKEEVKKINFNIRTREPAILRELLIETSLDSAEQEKVKILIESILKDKKASPETYHIAIWAGGKYKNNEIFEKLKEIALNKEEKDVRKRELAIHSTSMYAREKFKDVESIILSIAKEDSVFAPLGKIIHNKLNGTHYSQKDRELKNMDYNEKLRFKRWRDRFVISEKELSPREINAIDRGLYPFKNILKFFVKTVGKSITLMGIDSYTKYAPERAGLRGFSNGINNSGDFYDSIMGIHTKNGTFLGDKIERKLQDNMITHECAHLLHDYLFPNFKQKIQTLYEKALVENKAIDYYAKNNAFEYFAQGFEAYTSIYKPHKYIIDDDALSNTLYKLIQKDPDLYEFIDKLVKYGT